MRKPSKTAEQSARVMFSVQFPFRRAEEIDGIARRFGLSRHNLLRQAIEAGLPSVVATHAGTTAAPQQQG